MEAYFNVGSIDKPVLSNSSLSAINPEQGGSIRKFLNFFSNEAEKKNSLSLENGKLIHKYVENKDLFMVEDALNLPTDMKVGLIKEIFRINSFKNTEKLEEFSSEFVSDSKGAKKDLDLMEFMNAAERFAAVLECTVEEAIRIFRKARAVTKAYVAQKDDTLLKSIVESVHDIRYYKFLKSSSTKIVLTAEQHTIVSSATQSLFTHPKVSLLLNLREDDIEDKGADVFKELPIFWEDTFNVQLKAHTTVSTDAGTLPGLQRKIPVECKALLDNLTVDHDRKIITYTDLKSTRDSIYMFQKSFEAYRYYRQMAFYLRAIDQWFSKTYPDKDIRTYKVLVYIVPVETTGLFQTAVYEVPVGWLFKGTHEAKALCSRYAWHKLVGEYHYSKEEIENLGVLSFGIPN